MKHRSHYEPFQCCVQKDLTRKINDLLNAQSIIDSDPLAGGLASRLNLDLQKIAEQHNSLGMRATDLYKDHLLTSALDTIKNNGTSALFATQQAVLKAQEKFEAVDQLALLAAPASKTYSVLPCYDSIQNSYPSALFATQQAALKTQEMLKPVDQLALLAAPFGYERSVLSCVDSVVDTATFATMSPKGGFVDRVYCQGVTGDFAGFATFATRGIVLKR
ncbi:MAG: hypothetical protein FDX18_02705 [Chlorobium sp.]|nr:MAG: hypothetical protein FDX18_02705 [Chlorobium sp.]